MGASHLVANMQWETKAKFFGQVKPAGIEKSMSWKMGSVQFDYDAGSGSWMAKLYFKVNPTKVCQQIKIGQSDNLDVKCGRLIIENKKGDGIHIKLSNNDIINAKLLVSKIKNSMAITPTNNRAEVGLISNSTMSNHKGSENVSPFRSKDSDNMSLFPSYGGISPERQSGIWLSKKTPPMKNREHNPTPKRRLELFSSEPERGRNGFKEDDKLYSSQSFTGMKDYSKRNLNGGNNLSLNTGVGARSFYGAQNSLTNNNGYSNTSTNSSRGFDRSPALKRSKLSSSVSLSSQGNRMAESRICDSTLISGAKETEDALSREISVQCDEAPRRHFRAGETVGFQNLGNTCFLNSPLQCLSSLEPLSCDIQSAVAEYGMELNRNSITRKLYLLMKDVRKLDACPEHIKEILIRLRTDMNVKFAPNTQQDAHELLSEVLNRLDEEVKAAIKLHGSARPLQPIQGTAELVTAGPEEDQAKSPSREGGRETMSSPNSISTPTEANFRWSYRKDIYFHECKTQVLSSLTEHEMTLMLAFDSSTKSLQDCINKYFESTDVEMKCEKCGKEEKATITRKIVRRPRVFILNLLRYHSENMEYTKKADHICVPSYISICGYCADDVNRPPQADPVFMMDRDANRGLYSFDNARSCRCMPEITLESAGPTEEVTPPARPPLLDRTGFDSQGDCFSSLTRNYNDLNKVMTKLVDVDHLVPGYKHPKGLFGKLLDYPEKEHRALISSRTDPNVNTTHYPRNIMDFEAPYDFSKSSPVSVLTEPFHSYGVSYASTSSLYGDEPLRIRTDKISFQTRRQVKTSLFVPEINKDHDGGIFSTPKIGRGSSENVEAERSSNYNQPEPDSYPETYDLRVLSDFLSANLRSIDQYQVDCKDRGFDLSELRERSQTLISELNETILAWGQIPPDVSQVYETRRFSNAGLHHEIALSEALLKKALNLEDSQWVLLLKDLFREVIEDLIIERYDPLSKEKSLDYLIDDLSLYVSAMQSGVLKSVNYEKDLIVESLKDFSEKLQTLQNNQQSSVSSQPEGTSHDTGSESYIQEDETVFLRKVVSFNKDVEFIQSVLNENDNYEDNQNAQNETKQKGRSSNDPEKYSSPVVVQSLWKDEVWNEENYSAFPRKHSPDSSSSKTSYLYNQLIQGKDVSLYSEADLQKVDYLSLTEDEMMIYAQALSRIEYEKEQTAQVENIIPDVDVLLDGGKDAVKEMADVTISSENDHPQKQQDASSTNAGEEYVTESSRTSSLKTDKSEMTSPTTALNVSSHKAELEASFESSLICKEDMCGLDEIDGEMHASGPVQRSMEEPLLVTDLNSPSPTRRTISSSSMYPVCGSLEQTDFGSQPFDTNLSELQTGTLFYDLPNKEFSPSKASKCSTSSNSDISVGSSEIPFVENYVDIVTEEMVHSPVQSPLSAKELLDRSDHSVSHSNHSSKEYLFSPSKTNNLVKTRDYARLKSPAASPKKRTAKGQQPKSVSPTKRLHFSGEDRLSKNLKSSPDRDETLSDEDCCTNSDMLYTSMEVNIDDTSFYDNINSRPFVHPSALTISHSTPLSTPKSNTSISGSSSKCGTNDQSLSHPGKGSISPFSNPTVEDGSFQQGHPQSNQLSDMQVDQVETSARIRKIVSSEKIQNIEPESSFAARMRINRPIADAVGSEEKENMPKNLVRASSLQNMELGKAELSYKLVGVVDHTGNSQFTGHYTAYTFNMRKQKWFHLNDSETQMVTEEEVQENNTQTGYLFFYMDKDLFNDYTVKANAASSLKSPS